MLKVSKFLRFNSRYDDYHSHLIVEEDRKIEYIELGCFEKEEAERVLDELESYILQFKSLEELRQKLHID